MGTAIATLCAAHGYEVALCDNNAAMLESFPSRAVCTENFIRID